MAYKKSGKKMDEKKVTRYTYDDVKEPITPETGHTALLPAEEQIVTLPMDNGWSKAIKVGKLPEGDERPVIVDMDPAVDPLLFWAGKRNKREVPILPLQRNEIVSESRIGQIVARAQKAAVEKDPNAKQGSLFSDLEKALRESHKGKRVEFYTHEEGWKNKLICGDSLHAMQSLLHYEGMRGKVQMIYIDPPYGIKYGSNFQQRVDSTKNDDKDQADDVLTIKAFMDTWALGIHSYLSYLEERLYLCRELLADGGSVFVQIGPEHIHRVRLLLDEVFGSENFARMICLGKTGGLESKLLNTTFDYVLWYAKDVEDVYYQAVFKEKKRGEPGATKYTKVMLPDGSSRPATEEELTNDYPSDGGRFFLDDNLTSQGNPVYEFSWKGKTYRQAWKTTKEALQRLGELGRLYEAKGTLRYIRYFDDFLATSLTDNWSDVGGIQSRLDSKVFVVQTAAKAVERCLLMTTRPGDLVFDPTCGSGTTAFCGEKLGRRWITCDTSRVAINVARQRLLSAIFEQYKTRNAKVSGNFFYKMVKRITLKSLAYDLEPEKVELVDQPEIDRDAIRVCGPFEVMSLGRYSVEDWKGYLVREPEGAFEVGKLENYIQVICRLYRKDSAIQEASGLVHAVAESEKQKIAISVGPLSGRVTAKQINDAVQDAISLGILEVHILGWAFEANVGEVKSHLESRGKVKVELIMIRPDTLAEGLKITKGETLFSPLALPDIEVKVSKNGKKAQEATVTLKGVAFFDRKTRTTEYHHADSGYISAWYLDEDYDGDCFVDCQMFFDFKKAPNLRAALRVEVDPDEYKLQLTSNPFPVRNYKRLAVKVVDVYGNESTVVRDLT